MSDSTVSQRPSIRDIDPIEEGGPNARKGYAYQDHVAAGRCLDMLSEGGPSEVWCEAEDDIVLIWTEDSEEFVELVQVKSDELDQLWSTAKLCTKETTAEGKQGKSIVEKSLVHDRVRERCCFRIVTLREPNSDLAVLKLPLDEEVRTGPGSGVDDIVKSIVDRLGDIRSPNGNGVAFWVKATVWEVKASTKNVENENLLKLDGFLHRENELLAPDQRSELYAKLLKQVYDASLAKGRAQRDQKRICKAELRQWLLTQAAGLARSASAGRSDTLEAKLKEAGYRAPADEIETAKEQRREYRKAILQPRFLDLGDRQVLESEVQARLCRLKAQLDAGEFPDTGVQFHSRCLKELEALRNTLETQRKPLLGLIYGLMYEIMNRCQHRLVRAST